MGWMNRLPVNFDYYSPILLPVRQFSVDLMNSSSDDFIMKVRMIEVGLWGQCSQSIRSWAQMNFIMRIYTDWSKPKSGVVCIPISGSNYAMSVVLFTLRLWWYGGQRTGWGTAEYTAHIHTYINVRHLLMRWCSHLQLLWIPRQSGIPGKAVADELTRSIVKLREASALSACGDSCSKPPITRPVSALWATLVSSLAKAKHTGDCSYWTLPFRVACDDIEYHYCRSCRDEVVLYHGFVIDWGIFFSLHMLNRKPRLASGKTRELLDLAWSYIRIVMELITVHVSIRIGQTCPLMNDLCISQRKVPNKITIRPF